MCVVWQIRWERNGTCATDWYWLSWKGAGGDVLRPWATAWQLGQQSVEFCMWTGRPSLFFPTPRHNLWNADLTGRAGISAPRLAGAAAVRARAACRDKQSPQGAGAPPPFGQRGKAGLPGTRPWGLAGGKGGCGLHGRRFNTGTQRAGTLCMKTPGSTGWISWSCISWGDSGNCRLCGSFTMTKMKIWQVK